MEVEVAAFLNSGDHPIVGNEDFQLLREKMYYQASRKIPLRFSVLAGECIHHFRSCLDYIVWSLSSPEYRNDFGSSIEFPIFVRQPLTKDEASRYERKIMGVVSDAARGLIDSVQPYHRANPISDHLWITHEMDRIDKHRGLVITMPIFDFNVPPHLVDAAHFYASNEFLPIPTEVAREFKKHQQFPPQIAFAEITEGELKPVIPTLFQLEGDVRLVVASFDGELRKTF